MNITIYSKKQCCLCEDAKRAIYEALKERTVKDTVVKDPVKVSEVDIETNKELFDKYKYLIPVVEVNGKITFFYRVNKDELLRLLR